MRSAIILVLIYFTCCCANHSFGQAATRSTASEYAAMENNFVAPVEMISSQQIALFQKKSVQQIQDWIDLTDLLSSQDWEPALREKLNEQALSFFTSPSDSLFWGEGKNLKTLTVEDYLAAIKTDTNSSSFSIISTSTPIPNDSNYNWTLTFNLKKQDTPEKKYVAKVILKKEKKVFGKIEKEVWDVFIQEIRELSK